MTCSCLLRFKQTHCWWSLTHPDPPLMVHDCVDCRVLRSHVAQRLSEEGCVQQEFHDGVARGVCVCVCATCQHYVTGWREVCGCTLSSWGWVARGIWVHRGGERRDDIRAPTLGAPTGAGDDRCGAPADHEAVALRLHHYAGASPCAVVRLPCPLLMVAVSVACS